jgi:hypothetical protein
VSIDLTTPWGAVINAAVSIIDKVIPDPAQKAAAQLAVMQLQQTGDMAKLQSQTELALAQINVDNTEAASNSLYKSGWRPATGWICAFGLAYQFVLNPFISWLGTNLIKWAPPPNLDMVTLLTLLGGLLGLGTLRTIDKAKGTA